MEKCTSFPTNLKDFLLNDHKWFEMDNDEHVTKIMLDGTKEIKKDAAEPNGQPGFQPGVVGDHQENDSTWGSDTLRIPFKNE